MNHNYSGVNNLNGINVNVMNKYSKVNRQNYKTISINNNIQSNYIKNNYSKNIIQQQGNAQEKKKKFSNSKISNVKKEKKNYIPKMKPENIDTQLIFNNNDSNYESTHHRNYSNNSIIKKEIQLRHTSSSQKKVIINNQKNSKDLNLIRKKLIIGNVPMIMNNNSISNKHIPISNEFLTSNENYNNGKFIKRSNTNSNINENINNMNHYGEIFRYKKIIKILMFYIENLNKKIKYFFNKNQVEKNNKIKELSLQNKFLINENKNLKFKLIQFFYVMKTYINNGNKIHEEKYQKVIKEMITENKFLRSINILPKNINNAYLSQLQKQIQIEKMKKELLFHKQFTKKEENNQNNNNSTNSKDNKDINNPFNDDESTLNKVSHKRQRTHFNLGKLNEENSINSVNRDSIGSNKNTSNASSENTAIENKNKGKEKESLILKHIKSKTQSQNALSETLKDMSNYNKSLKKANNDSKKNVLENKKERELNNKNANDNSNFFSDIKNNRLGSRIVSNNIPVNTNKVEYIHYSNEKKNKLNNVENNSEMDKKKEDSTNGNENIGIKKQQSIYYRASREKEKKKLIFNK